MRQHITVNIMSEFCAEVTKRMRYHLKMLQKVIFHTEQAFSLMAQTAVKDAAPSTMHAEAMFTKTCLRTIW